MLCYAHGAGSGECVYVVVPYNLTTQQRETVIGEGYYRPEETERNRGILGLGEEIQEPLLLSMIEKMKGYTAKSTAVYLQTEKKIDAIRHTIRPKIEPRGVDFVAKVLEKIETKASTFRGQNIPKTEKGDLRNGLSFRFQQEISAMYN